MTLFSFSLSFRLRTVRERRNLSQQELADKMGMARNTVSNAENRGEPKLSTLVALSGAMGVPPHTWLLPDDEWFEWFCGAHQDAEAASWWNMGKIQQGKCYCRCDACKYCEQLLEAA